MNPTPARTVLPDLTRVSGDDLRICIMFNRVARDSRGPNALRKAFDITKTRMGFEFNDKRIMHALMNAKLTAPKTLLPKGYARFVTEMDKPGMSGKFCDVSYPRTTVPPAFMIPKPAPAMGGLVPLAYRL